MMITMYLVKIFCFDKNHIKYSTALFYTDMNAAKKRKEDKNKLGFGSLGTLGLSSFKSMASFAGSMLGSIF